MPDSNVLVIFDLEAVEANLRLREIVKSSSILLIVESTRATASPPDCILMKGIHDKVKPDVCG